MTEDIFELLEPISPDLFHSDFYADTQIGHGVDFISNQSDLHLKNYDLIILSCEEYRGDLDHANQEPITQKIREKFYQLEDWHKLKIADIGTLNLGMQPSDTYAALAAVGEELTHFRAKVLLLGGSDDLTYGFYKAYANTKKIIEVSIIDSHVDFKDEININSSNYLNPILLEEPNYTRHLNVIGFQSYFVQPNLLEVLDDLRFDFMRLGRLRENITHGESMMRNSEIVSIDLKAVSHPYHQYSEYASPNGFDGAEICSFMRFAGMSDVTKFVGCFDLTTIASRWENTAVLLSQMMWYLLEGINIGKSEAPFEDEKSYLRFTVESDDKRFEFRKSKRTSRWWIQLPDSKWLPCNYEDYMQASQDRIPERWLRAMEK